MSNNSEDKDNKIEEKKVETINNEVVNKEIINQNKTNSENKTTLENKIKKKKGCTPCQKRKLERMRLLELKSKEKCDKCPNE